MVMFMKKWKNLSSSQLVIQTLVKVAIANQYHLDLKHDTHLYVQHHQGNNLIINHACLIRMDLFPNHFKLQLIKTSILDEEVVITRIEELLSLMHHKLIEIIFHPLCESHVLDHKTTLSLSQKISLNRSIKHLYLTNKYLINLFNQLEMPRTNFIHILAQSHKI